MMAGFVAALLYGDAGTEEAEPKSGFAKATKAPQQTAGATGNKRLTEQIRKILGKQYPSKYRVR